MITNRNLFLLSARDVMNYAYCKRIVYFERVLMAPQTTTIKEVAGRKKHVIESRNENRRTGHREFIWSRKLQNLEIEDQELGLKTVIDVVLIDGEKEIAVPLQFKNSPFHGFVYRGQKDQVVLESLLVERKLGLHVPFALIKFLRDGKVASVWIDDAKKAEFLAGLKEMQELVQKEQLPGPTPHVRTCIDCCFKKICARA